jgi:hypothetical protein
MLAAYTIAAQALQLKLDSCLQIMTGDYHAYDNFIEPVCLQDR